MAADRPMEFGAGFCPYCGHDNPPSFRFCISCRRQLPEGPRPKMPPAGPPRPAPTDKVDAPRPSDSPRAGPSDPTDRPAAGEGRPWFLLPVAVLAVVLIVLAGVELLPVYLSPHAPTSSIPSGAGKLMDLCIPTAGSDCKGFQFSLPATINNRLMNATGCDPFSSWGPGEILWMNYTAIGSIYAIVLPSSVFGGVLGWTVDAFEIVANETAVQSALWFSHLTSGSFTEAIQVPAGSGTYCIGWWEPSAGTVSVQWQSDITVTYQ